MKGLSKLFHTKVKIFHFSVNTLVNVNAPVVATTSWWLHFTAPVVAYKVKKYIPVDFIIFFINLHLFYL